MDDLWILVWRSQPWMMRKSQIASFVGDKHDVCAKEADASENGCGNLFCGSLALFEAKIKQEMVSEDGVSFTRVCT
jgi:hypothetical protein